MNDRLLILLMGILLSTSPVSTDRQVATGRSTGHACVDCASVRALFFERAARGCFCGINAKHYEMIRSRFDFKD